MKRGLLLYFFLCVQMIYGENIHLSMKNQNIPQEHFEKYTNAIRMSLLNSEFTDVLYDKPAPYSGNVYIFCRDTLTRGSVNPVYKIVVNYAITIKDKRDSILFKQQGDIESGVYYSTADEAYADALKKFAETVLKNDLSKACDRYFTKPIIISDVSIDTLYPSLLAGVKNNCTIVLQDLDPSDTKRNITVTVSIPTLKSKSTEQIILVNDTTLAITVNLNSEEVYRGADKKHAVEISLTGRYINSKKSSFIYIKPLNAISWSKNPYSICSFIPQSDNFRTLTNEILGKYTYKGLKADFYKIATLVEYIQQVKISSGTDMKYQRDDHVLYPSQMLNRSKKQNGDCDDFTVLMATLLYHSGIDVSIIEYPDHITLAAHLDIPYSNYDVISPDKRNTIPIEGKVAIPLESTSLNKGFLRAWKDGAKEYEENKKKRTIYSLTDGWKKSPPHRFNFPTVTFDNNFSHDKVNTLIKRLDKKFYDELDDAPSITVQQKSRHLFLKGEYESCLKYLRRNGNENSVATKHNKSLCKFLQGSLTKEEYVETLHRLKERDSTGHIALNHIVMLRTFHGDGHQNVEKATEEYMLKYKNSGKSGGVIIVLIDDEDEEDIKSGVYSPLKGKLLWTDDGEKPHRWNRKQKALLWTGITGGIAGIGYLIYALLPKEKSPNEVVVKWK